MPEVIVRTSKRLKRLVRTKGEYVIHVDSEVLKAIYAGERNRTTPIVRVLAPAGRKYYCHHVEIKGRSGLRTTWDAPLADRPRAICVLRTRNEIVLHG